MIKTLEWEGVSAIIIDDVMQNNTSINDSYTLSTEEQFCRKISDGKKSQVTQDFMIIAKIGELTIGKTIEEALQKSFAAVKAGADGIIIDSKESSGNDIKEFCQKFRKENKDTPIGLIPTSYSQIPEKELVEWGANVIIYVDYLLKTTYPAMKKCAETILKSERSLEVNDQCMPIKEILNLIPGTN